jgi:hypothetical protein
MTIDPMTGRVRSTVSLVVEPTAPTSAARGVDL